MIEKNKSISVPESWEQINLGNYERLEIEPAQTYMDIVMLVCRICKLEKEDILNYPCSLFNDLTNRIQFIFDPTFEPSDRVKINGTSYVVGDYTKMSLGEYIDITETLKPDNKHAISETLAIVLRPENEDYKGYDKDKIRERTGLLQSLPCADILPVAAFFLSNTINLSNALEFSLMVRQQADQYLKEWSDLVKNGAGTKPFAIWQRIKLMRSKKRLKYLLKKSSHSYYTNKIKLTQIATNSNLTNNVDDDRDY